MDVSLPVNIIYVDCVVFYVYITIQCIYVYTVYICTQKRRGADPAILRTKGTLVRETKGRVEVNIWNVWVYLSELFHYIISFFNSKGGGTQPPLFLPPLDPLATEYIFITRLSNA